MRLEIDRWTVRDKADSNGEYVHIRGREAGFTGFLQRWLGTEATTSLSIDDKRIRLARRSVSGASLRVTPLASMASVACGSCRPLTQPLTLAAGGLLAIAVPGAVWVGGALLLLLAPLSYFSSQRLFLELIDHGGKSVRIEFDRAEVADMRVDESTSAQLVSIVEMLRLRLATPRPLADARLLFDSSAQVGGIGSLRRELSINGARRLIEIFKVKMLAAATTAGGPNGTDSPDTVQPVGEAEFTDTEPFAKGPAGPVKLNCLACGAEVQPNDVYCGNCGQRLPFLPM